MLFAPLVLAIFATSAFAQTNTPLATVDAFYRFDRTHSQAFNRANIDARKQWLSNELYSLFRKELKREEAYLKKNPTDKPYFGDGLPFQPYDETCKAGRKTLHKALATRHDQENGKSARILATFAFPKPCKNRDATTYTLALVKAKTGWLIDDVLYEDNRSLKGDLNRKEY